MAVLSTMRTCLFHRLATLLSVISQETLFGAIRFVSCIHFLLVLCSLHSWGSHVREWVSANLYFGLGFVIFFPNSSRIEAIQANCWCQTIWWKHVVATRSHLFCAKSRIQWTWTRKIQATTTHQNVTYFDFTFRQPIPAKRLRHIGHTHTENTAIVRMWLR